MIRRIAWGGVVVVWLATGCGGVPSLPQTLDVATSASEKSPAAIDSGPAGLADSTWSLVRVDEPDDDPTIQQGGATPSGPYGGILGGERLDRPAVGERIFLVEFGAQGQMTQVRENRFFLPNIYGDEIEVTPDWHRAGLPGLSYHSASFGLEAAGRFGIAVVVHVRFGNFFAGQAVLYSWGTQTEDLIEGQFGYVIDFTDGLAPGLGIISDQYPVQGHRIE